MHVDETPLRVDKKDHWIHVYATGEITLKRLHKKRGKEAIAYVNIIPRYGGVIIHDCWVSYLSYDHCDHSLCGSHLLQQTCNSVSGSRENTVVDRAYKNVQKRYRTPLAKRNKKAPTIPEKIRGRRSKMAKSDAHSLWKHLKDHDASVLLFANDANCHLPIIAREEICECRKSNKRCQAAFEYSQAYCRISSYSMLGKFPLNLTVYYAESA